MYHISISTHDAFEDIQNFVLPKHLTFAGEGLAAVLAKETACLERRKAALIGPSTTDWGMMLEV